MDNDNPECSDKIVASLISSRRRAFTAAGLGVTAAVVASSRASAATASAASQNVITWGADPTGSSDSSPAFITAFGKLPSSGGTIIVPGGVYMLKSALSFSGKALSIKGEGSASTILAMAHTGVAITFSGTNSGYPSVTPFSIIGLSISGPTGSSAAAAGAIVATYPASQNETGYQYVFIDDLNIGVAEINGSNGCNITYGLSLANIWKSLIRNTRMFGPFGAGAFAQLSGTKNVDVNFENCVSDGPYYGIDVSCYTEGLRIINPLFISQIGLTTNFSNSSGINLLGLYIIGGEFNTFTLAADLYKVTQAYIADTHFSYQGTASSAVVTMELSLGVRMSNLIFSGEYPPNAASVYGLSMTGCSLCQVNGALFINLNNGLLYSSNCESNMALGLQLVNENGYPQLSPNPAAVDSSGVTGAGANNAQWMTVNGSYVTLR